MGQEISDSENWLESLVVATYGKRLKEALDSVSQYLRETAGIRIWFVKMLGRRWSYLAGQISSDPSSSMLERIKLERGVGLVSDNWEMLSGRRVKDLVIFLRWLVSTRTEKEHAPFKYNS